MTGRKPEIGFLNIWKHVLESADREDLWNDLIQRCVDLQGMLRYPLRCDFVKAFLFTLCLVLCTVMEGSKKSCKEVRNRTTVTLGL